MLKNLGMKIRKIDYFGKSFSFEELESENYNTILGMILTMGILVACIVIGIMFGQELYLRKNPTAFMSQELTEYSNIQVRKFPLIFYFTYSTTNLKNVSSVFDITVRELTGHTNNTATLREYSGLVKCDESLFDEGVLKEEYIKFEKKNEENKENGYDYYCLPQNFSIQNEFASRNSTTISVLIDTCDKTVRKCHPDLDNILKRSFVILGFFDTYLDPNNYTNPISYYYNQHAQELTPNMTKRNYYKFGNRKIVTDEGWIMEDYKTQEYIGLSAITQDILHSLNRKIYQISLTSPNLSYKTTRKYTKFQDVLASVGGFLKALTVACYLLIQHYVSYCYYLQIYKVVKQEEIVTKKETKSFACLPNVSNFNSENRFTVKTNALLNEEIGIKNNNFVKNKSILHEIKKTAIAKDLDCSKLSNNSKNLSEQYFSKPIIKESPVKLQKSEEDEEFISGNQFYLYYLFSILCCKKENQSKKIDYTRKYLSFNNILKLNLREN